MTIIRVTCDSGHVIDLKPEEVSIIEGGTKFTFFCAECALGIEKRADPKILGILQSAGVKEGPAKLPEPDQHDVSAPAFTEDDLIDFHFTMDDDLEELLS